MSQTTSAQARRTTIAELKPNERFEGIYSIANAQLAVTKNGDPYLACLLGDKTQQVPARRWQMPPEEFKHLPTEGFVYAEGRTQPFKGELQMIIDRVEKHDPTPEEIRELLPCSQFDPKEMFAEVRGILDTLEHPAIKALAQVYLDDEPLMEMFRAAPAAKMMHHAYIGGLLEHTLNLMRLAVLVCPLYPKINRDIVLIGLFLHDLGKTRELSWNGGFSYTDRGELVGHIVGGGDHAARQVAGSDAVGGDPVPGERDHGAAAHYFVAPWGAGIWCGEGAFHARGGAGLAAG